MPIVALVISTLAFWFIFWFFRMGGLEQMREAAARRKDAARLAKARESERTAPLRAVDDPRDAAVILMLLMARVGGDPTREQIAAIEKIVSSVFGADYDLANRMRQARFIAGRADSFEQAAGLFTDLFTKRLTDDERRQLVRMVEEVAELEHRSEAHAEAIGVLRRRMGLATAN
jgi:uncharacterized tellurite resistance protein B-like protein